ncbi:hypothetical protein GCM10011367_24280 [Marinicauda pacifica]|jgi:hypothetical protein|uniref:DUF6471 domain-containing protein n=1 Tax=Marinicauda pacifica TaxID=1133559 RepID=A0A4S2H972_9PROT|nr:DUF6471 domain-containing protein [Marinicauda pacifica]TGY92405.1 hypothetical protein E5162_12220 [Marinicauda pacifica]GGE48604.1 hypothetical protein GCM10011367_24280 [Marinicauda pacifica]
MTDARATEKSAEEYAQEWVKQLIRREMGAREISYKELCERLSVLNVDINEHALRNKVARGTFSAAFFVYLLEAMEVKAVYPDYISQELYRHKLKERGIEPLGKPRADQAYLDEDEMRHIVQETTKDFLKSEFGPLLGKK